MIDSIKFPPSEKNFCMIGLYKRFHKNSSHIRRLFGYKKIYFLIEEKITHYKWCLANEIRKILILYEYYLEM